MSDDPPPIPPMLPSIPAPAVHPPVSPAPPDALLRAVAAGEATAAEESRVRALAATDPSVAARLAAASAVEEALRGEALLPLPLGLVTRILAHVEDAGTIDGVAAPGMTDGTRVGASPSRSRREWIAIAAGAVLALGTGIGGLWTVAGSGDLGALVGATADPASPPDAGPVASLASLASEARASTHSAVSSLATVPERVPGSPGTLGLGAVALLGAAVVGARRTIRGRAAGPASVDASGPGRRGS